MSIKWTALVADDEPYFRDILSSELAKSQCEVEVLGSANDGDELLALHKQYPFVDLVITDIRMPKLDGLSALIQIKQRSPAVRVLMASSESKKNMSTRRTTSSEASFAEGLTLLDKIAERIRSGTTEPGKMNSILEGCEKLGIDPFAVANHYGASGYIQKPALAVKLDEVFAALDEGAKFVHFGIGGTIEAS